MSNESVNARNIQTLHQRIKALQLDNTEQSQKVAKLEQMLAQLQQQLASVNARLYANVGAGPTSR